MSLKVGETVGFVYNGGTRYGINRFVLVQEIIEDALKNKYYNIGYIKGIDLVDGKFKSFSYEKIKINSLYILATENQETMPVEKLHVNTDNLNNDQLLSIFKIIYPDKLNPTKRLTVPFIVYDSMYAKIKVSMENQSILLVDQKGISVSISPGKLSVKDLQTLHAFLERVRV